jgi:hypothetical protein
LRLNSWMSWDDNLTIKWLLHFSICIQILHGHSKLIKHQSTPWTETQANHSTTDFAIQVTTNF